MLEWRVAIGNLCVTCHSGSKDHTNVNGAGLPEIEPYDDTKPEYKAGSEMYVLTREINKKYLSTSKAPVTCSTCHRGHLIPEAFVAPPEPHAPSTQIPPTQPKQP